MFNKFVKEESNSNQKPPKMAIAFAGPTGTGKSTMLVNVAGIIQKYSPYNPSICILDMDLFYPSVIHLLHQDDMHFSKKALSDIMKRVESISLDELKKNTHVHIPTNIHILGTDLSEINQEKDLYSEEKIRTLIKKLKQLYDIVLIDTTANIKHDEVLVSLVESEKIIMITNPDINKALHTRKLLSVMKMLDGGFHSGRGLFEKTQIVVNKHDKRKGFTTETLENALYGKLVEKIIEENNEITSMHNNGIFFYDKTSTEARNMIELARIIYSNNV